jgi:hypothetical protein
MTPPDFGAYLDSHLAVTVDYRGMKVAIKVYPPTFTSGIGLHRLDDTMDNMRRIMSVLVGMLDSDLEFEVEVGGEE